MVSYSISEAGALLMTILLVGLRSYNARLSVTFMGDMQCMPNSVVKLVSYCLTPEVHESCIFANSILYFDLATFFISFMLYACF